MTTAAPDLYRIVDGLFFGRVYWMLGDVAGVKHGRREVRNPPSSGWSHCFVIDKGAKLVTLFCPYTLDSFQVSRNASEYLTMTKDPAHHPVPGKPGLYAPSGFKQWSNKRHDRLLKIMLDAWAQAGKLSLSGRDYDTAAMVISMMGGDVPLRTASVGVDQDKVRGGKEAGAAGLLKPVKRSGRRGQVLAFFLPGARSIREAMAEFGVSRSNILSQLYLLQKDHGIGYTLTGDAATIALPQGCEDPFEQEKQ